MSLEISHFINGISVTPMNADEIGFKMDWTGDPKEAELTTDTILLANKGKQLVLDHIETLGVFEGIPYTIQFGNITLDYFIDLTETPVISGKGDSKIEVTLKRRKSIDWFIFSARNLSFEAINKTNPISLIDVPYLIVRDNQLEMLIMLGISTYTLTKALIEGIQDLVVAVTDFIKIVSVGTVVNTGQIIAAALLLVARLIYIAALLIALIDLTKQIIELIFPPIRNLKASRFKELCIKGCQKLGMNFSSTLLDNMSNMTFLPVPLKENNKSIFTNLFSLDNGSYTKGYPTARDSSSTLGLLIEDLESFFSAEIRIVGNTVFLEQDTYWQLNANLTIKNTLNIQDARENEWRYNLAEAWKRYLISYRTDTSDTNTLDKIKKNIVEYSTEPVTVVNADLVTIKGLIRVDNPWALGIRKEELTVVEEACLPFAKLADEVVGFFGGSSNLEAKVLGRVGVLQISQQYYSVSKLLYCSANGRQGSTYLDTIGAIHIHQNYHIKNQVKENFKKIYLAPIPLSTTNFETVLNNNYVYDESGNSLKILTFEFNNHSKTADIEYTVKSNEGDNTKTVLING